MCQECKGAKFFSAELMQLTQELDFIDFADICKPIFSQKSALSKNNIYRIVIGLSLK